MSVSRVYLSSVPPYIFSCDAHHRALHSFPTRRSSDLRSGITGLPGRSAQSKHVPYAARAPWTLSPAPPSMKIGGQGDRKSTRLNSSQRTISYAVFCLKKKTKKPTVLERLAQRRHDICD